MSDKICEHENLHGENFAICPKCCPHNALEFRDDGVEGLGVQCPTCGAWFGDIYKDFDDLQSRYKIVKR